MGRRKVSGLASRCPALREIQLEEADQAAGRVVAIDKGRLLADGTPAQIKAPAGAKRRCARSEQHAYGVTCGAPTPAA